MPQISVGPSQLLRHGLNAWGGNMQLPSSWSGTFGVGFVALWYPAVNIVCPDGSYVFGRASFNCYTSVAGSVIEGCAQENGAGLVGWGKYMFNNLGGSAKHTQYAYSFYVGRLSPGSHTLAVGIYTESGQITFDSNCGGVCLLWETAI